MCQRPWLVLPFFLIACIVCVERGTTALAGLPPALGNDGQPSTIPDHVFSDSSTGTARPPDGYTRQHFAYFGFGFLEFLSLGGGIQANNDWAIAIKANAVLLSGGSFGNGGYGLGLRLTRFLSNESVGVNALNVEPSYLFSVSTDPQARGFSVEVTIGHENIHDDGFLFFWRIGGVVSSAPTTSTLYMLSAKIGLIWNM